MFHNHTNQIPVFALNRNLPDNPPPRYTRIAHGCRLFDISTVCLSSFLLFCFLILLFLIILGQVFILNRLEQMTVTCLIQESTQTGMCYKVSDNRQNSKSRYFLNIKLQYSSARACSQYMSPHCQIYLNKS